MEYDDGECAGFVCFKYYLPDIIDNITANHTVFRPVQLRNTHKEARSKKMQCCDEKTHEPRPRNAKLTTNAADIPQRRNSQ